MNLVIPTSTLLLKALENFLKSRALNDTDRLFLTFQKCVCSERTEEGLLKSRLKQTTRGLMLIRTLVLKTKLIREGFTNYQILGRIPEKVVSVITKCPQTQNFGFI